MPVSGQTVRIVPLCHSPSLLHYFWFFCSFFTSVQSLLSHSAWVKGVQRTLLSNPCHDVMVSAGGKCAFAKES